MLDRRDAVGKLEILSTTLRKSIEIAETPSASINAVVGAFGNRIPQDTELVEEGLADEIRHSSAAILPAKDVGINTSG